MARSRPSFLNLRKIIGRPALRPWFLIYWFLIKEGGGVCFYYVIKITVLIPLTRPPPPIKIR